MAETLGISRKEAEEVLTVLSMQGHVQPNRGDSDWITTPAGEEVSSSKMPRYTRESVDRALSEFGDRLKELKKDSESEFRIRDAVAFGDFLLRRPRAQAADVGVGLEYRDWRRDHEQISLTKAGSFLKRLKRKSPLFNVQPYEPWMSQRTHRKLL